MTDEIQRWEAAKKMLNAYTHIRHVEILTPDVTSAVITELLTDLISFCDGRNKKYEDTKDVSFPDFDHMVKAAKTRGRT